jgi:hypothetical protein
MMNPDRSATSAVHGGYRLVLALTFGLLVACGRDPAGLGPDPDAGAGEAGVLIDASLPGDGALVPDGGPGGDAGWYSEECQITYCQDRLYACGDCEDNDGDGLVDARDPACLGPCDNNEAGFNTLIPGANAQPCMADCYFDGDSGAGNDQCYWDLRCDPLEPEAVQACLYEQPCASCTCEEWAEEQSAACLGYCLPLVPNGCDCFGCCALDPGATDWRFIGSPGCGPDDVEACDPCTPVPGCQNGCGPCELCLGRTELPPECGGTQTCEGDLQLCGLAGDAPCPAGTYCVTGCCAPVVVD